MVSYPPTCNCFKDLAKPFADYDFFTYLIIEIFTDFFFLFFRG